MKFVNTIQGNDEFINAREYRRESDGECIDTFTALIGTSIAVKLSINHSGMAFGNDSLEQMSTRDALSALQDSVT